MKAKTRAFVLFFILCGTARAELPSIQLQLTSLLISDVSVNRTSSIRDQGNYPYCTLHAFVAFLEMWANSRDRAWTVGHLEPAYLAMAYNKELANGAGTSIEWLLYSTLRHGAIPTSAWNETIKKAPWARALGNDWQAAHRSLIDSAVLDQILAQEFEDPDTKLKYTGSSFLANWIRIDLKKFRTVSSTYEESIIQTPTDNFGTENYRKDGEVPRWQLRDTLFKEAGMEVDQKSVSPEKLYDWLKIHLYYKEPILVSLNVGIVNGYFGQHRVVSLHELKPVGEGRWGPHTALAVGHCDNWTPKEPLCKPFAQQMKERNVPECIVIQNSWGPSAHDKGYVCVSKLALDRIMSNATVRD